MRNRALAGFLLAFLCLSGSAQAFIVSKVWKAFKEYVVDNVADVAKTVLVDGVVDGLGGQLIDSLEGLGYVNAEQAEMLRQSSDVIESALKTGLDGTACYFGGVLDPSEAAQEAVSAVEDGEVTANEALRVLSSAVNPACKDAAAGVFNTAAELVEAVAYDGTAAACDGSALPMPDVVSCISHCESWGSCNTMYMDHGCCLCKPYCDDNYDTNDDDGTAAITMTDWEDVGSPSEEPPLYFDWQGALPPTPADASPSASCGAFQYDTDYYGGDIVPVTTKWADTAVSAASPEDCCEACTLYSYCQAWTFTAATNCKERLPHAPGCCFLKKGSGYEVQAAPGMVSGKPFSSNAASCTLEFDTDLFGGDIPSGSYEDTVVPTFSDADCCQSCARTPGCGAWTMTPPDHCADRVPGARGCCFLKSATGWTRTKDEQGVMTSGELVSTAISTR